MDVAFDYITIDRSKKPFKVEVDMSNWYRPTARGEIDETDELIHTGYVDHPDDREYQFWYHTDEAKIYWDHDKGNTSNIWHGKKKGSMHLLKSYSGKIFVTF